MAAGIAHEIRNPLASMSGSIQVLRQELPLSDEQAQLMDIVLRESERLNDTIRSFLAYARPQRFARRAARRPARSCRTRRCCCATAPTCARTTRVDVDVPAEPVWYEADENQIRQIVWNLATNGLRAMAAGRPAAAGGRDRRATASGATSCSPSRTRGAAFRPRSSTRIFQPFRSSFEKGTGLGLAIVHRIVTDYSGTIQVSSTVGAGTTVRVRLPVRGAHRGRRPPRDAAEPQEAVV